MIDHVMLAVLQYVFDGLFLCRQIIDGNVWIYIKKIIGQHLRQGFVLQRTQFIDKLLTFRILKVNSVVAVECVEKFNSKLTVMTNGKSRAKMVAEKCGTNVE